MAHLMNSRGTDRTDLFARLSVFFADISERMAQYRVYRNTLAELDGLSERELNDLGLNRDMLRSIAHQAAYPDAQG